MWSKTRPATGEVVLDMRCYLGGVECGKQLYFRTCLPSFEHALRIRSFFKEKKHHVQHTLQPVSSCSFLLDFPPLHANLPCILHPRAPAHTGFRVWRRAADSPWGVLIVLSGSSPLG